MRTQQRRSPDPYLKRMGVFAALGLLGLIVGALLGPTPEQVDEFFRTTGREGPTLVLQEIDIIPDNDPVSTPPRDTMAGATQGVQVPVEALQKPKEDATEPTPSQQVRGVVDPSQHATDIPMPGRSLAKDQRDQIEQHRASQQSLDFILQKFVRPDYPSGAGQVDRTRTIVVWVAMYVNELGKVEHAYIERSDGGPLFEQAVLEAVLQWEYRPLVVDNQPQGFWDRQQVQFIVTRDGVETRIGDHG